MFPNRNIPPNNQTASQHDSTLFSEISSHSSYQLDLGSFARRLYPIFNKIVDGKQPHVKWKELQKLYMWRLYIYNSVSKQISLTSLNYVAMEWRHTNLTKENILCGIWFDFNLILFNNRTIRDKLKGQNQKAKGTGQRDKIRKNKGTRSES